MPKTSSGGGRSAWQGDPSYGAFNSGANLDAITAGNSASAKRASVWGPQANELFSGMGAVNNDIGQFITRGGQGDYINPIDAVHRAMEQYSGPAKPKATPGNDPTKSEYGGGSLNLDALGSMGNQAQQAQMQQQQQQNPPPGSGGGLGYNIPQATLNLPSQDYNSYLAQAQKALDFGAIAQPYDQAIGQVGKDTGIAVGNIGAAAQGAQQNIAGGTALIQQGAKQANQQGAQLESALSQQAQGAAGNQAAGNASLAASLGMSGAQGQLNPGANAQAQAAQQALAAAAQDNAHSISADSAAQVADNQGYGRVVDAKKTADQQNAELAAEDAKAGIGLQKGTALLGARQSAASNAMTMQQNAMQNALAAFQEQANYGLGLGGLQQTEQGLGLKQYEDVHNVGFQNAQLAQAVLGAKATAIEQMFGTQGSNLLNALKYGQVNAPLSGQLLSNGTQEQSLLNALFGNTLGGLPAYSKNFLQQNPGIAQQLPGGTPTYQGG